MTRAAVPAPPARSSPVRAAALGPLLALAALLATAGTAHAHADLVSATPPPDSHLDEAPEQLILVFSEELERRYTKVSVLDSRGRDYARATDIDPEARTRVTVPLDPMGDGVFTVHWQTLSVDTHTKKGAYLLAVGNATLSHEGMDHAQHAAHSGSHDHGGGFDREAVTRGAGFPAASLAVGIPLFLLSLRPGTLYARHERALAAGAGIAGLLAAGAALLLASRIGARIEATLPEVFATTSGGWLAWRAGLLALAGALALGAVAATGRPLGRGLLGGSAVAGVASLGATTLSGHAAALATGRGLAVAVDWVHLVAVAYWVGGVLALLAVVWTLRPHPRRAFRAVARFSPLAVASVLVIILTGAYTTSLHLGGPEDLRSEYGKALGLKMLLMLPLLALGYGNRYVFAPRLFKGHPVVGLRPLRALMSVEVGLMGVALVAAGVLANTAPPGSAVDPAAGATLAPPGTVHEFNASGYHGFVALTPQPVRVGVQTLTVVLHPVTAGDIENATAYAILTPPSDPFGEGEVHPLSQSGTLRWSLRDSLFTESGEWKVRILVQGKGVTLQTSLGVNVS